MLDRFILSSSNNENTNLIPHLNFFFKTVLDTTTLQLSLVCFHYTFSDKLMKWSQWTGGNLALCRPQIFYRDLSQHALLLQVRVQHVAETDSHCVVVQTELSEMFLLAKQSLTSLPNGRAVFLWNKTMKTICFSAVVISPYCATSVQVFASTLIQKAPKIVLFMHLIHDSW